MFASHPGSSAQRFKKPETRTEVTPDSFVIDVILEVSQMQRQSDMHRHIDYFFSVSSTHIMLYCLPVLSAEVQE